MTITHFDSNKRLSKAVAHGNTLYLGGITPDDPNLNIVEQTRQVLAKVDDLLARAGTHKGRILLANILLRTLDDWEGMNSVWDAWVDGEHPPCRYSYGNADIGGPPPGWRVEMVAFAAI
jgi:enamine deaminase RidA (YjgF/YER057c/UK114 family)